MPVLAILLVLILAGVLLWLLNQYIPMDGKIRTILNFVLVILIIVWLLKAFGVFHYMRDMHV